MVGAGIDLALLLLGRDLENVVVAMMAATFGNFCRSLVRGVCRH
jgi:hypothetical protein